MNRRLLLAAAVTGCLGVILGAFGAHGIRERVEATALEWWETGARYHQIHAVAALAVALAGDRLGRLGAAAGWSFIGGIAVFSGTLYAMTLTGVRILGAVTPIGGLGLIAGWVLLAVAGWRAGTSAHPPR
jgi:uncharacterized membrane protein YgdD (TMEM256/DUF423 family)